MNDYFTTITQSLDIKKWPKNLSASSDIPTENIILKYNDHPSIQKIKSTINISGTFEFTHITPLIVKAKIDKLDSSKSIGGSIPITILKENVDCYKYFLTDFFNNCINDGIFPGDLKLADVTPVFKADDKTNKSNYRPISLLPALSKILEKIICDQINEYMNNKLASLLCGFRKNYGTEDALLHLLENWRDHLDKKGL